MTAPAPTPLPWHVGGIAGRSPIVYAANGRPVANTTVYWSGSEQPDMHANAELIVRAVNAHDELIAALRELTRAYVGDWPMTQDKAAAGTRAYNAARALLARLGPPDDAQAYEADAELPALAARMAAALSTVRTVLDDSSSLEEPTDRMGLIDIIDDALGPYAAATQG